MDGKITKQGPSLNTALSSQKKWVGFYPSPKTEPEEVSAVTAERVVAFFAELARFGLLLLCNAEHDTTTSDSIKEVLLGSRKLMLSEALIGENSSPKASEAAAVIAQKSSKGKVSKHADLAGKLFQSINDIIQCSTGKKRSIFWNKDRYVYNTERREEVFFPVSIGSDIVEQVDGGQSSGEGVRSSGAFIFPHVDSKTAFSNFIKQSRLKKTGFTHYYGVSCIMGSSLRGSDGSNTITLIKHNVEVYSGQVIKRVFLSNRSCNIYKASVLAEMQRLDALIQNTYCGADGTQARVIIHLPYMDYLFFSLDLLLQNKLTKHAFKSFNNLIIQEAEIYKRMISGQLGHHNLSILSPFDVFEKDIFHEKDPTHYFLEGFNLLPLLNKVLRDHSLSATEELLTYDQLFQAEKDTLFEKSAKLSEEHLQNWRAELFDTALETLSSAKDSEKITQEKTRLSQYWSLQRENICKGASESKKTYLSFSDKPIDKDIEGLFGLGNPIMQGVLAGEAKQDFSSISYLPVSERRIQVEYNKMLKLFPETFPRVLSLCPIDSFYSMNSDNDEVHAPFYADLYQLKSETRLSTAFSGLFRRIQTIAISEAAIPSQYPRSLASDLKKELIDQAPLSGKKRVISPTSSPYSTFRSASAPQPKNISLTPLRIEGVGYGESCCSPAAVSDFQQRGEIQFSIIAGTQSFHARKRERKELRDIIPEPALVRA